MVKGRRRRLLAFRNVPRPKTRINEKQILVTVIVEIKKRNAPAHRFRQQLLAVSSILMNKGNPGFLRHISKFRNRHLLAGKVRDRRHADRPHRRNRRFLLLFQQQDKPNSHRDRQQDQERPANRLANDRIVCVRDREAKRA
jgi:hypothetical protein